MERHRSTDKDHVGGLALITLVAGLLVLLFLRIAPARGDGGVFPTAPRSKNAGPNEDEAALALLVRGEMERGEDTLVVDPPEAVNGRVAVEVAPGSEPATDEPAPLQGYVLDAAGRPLANLDLAYREGLEEVVRFDREAGRASSARTFSSAARTNAHGEFAFDGPDRKNGGVVVFRPAEYVEGHVVTPVDAGSDWQALQALPAPHQDSACTFWLTDSQVMRPVDIEAVRIEHVDGSFDFPRRYPYDHERTIETEDRATKLVQRGLAPGTWRFTFVLRHGLHQRVEVTIDEPGTEKEMTVLVETWEDGRTTDIEFEAAPDGSLPWIDSSSGMEDWLPDVRLRVGDSVYDRYFAETLRIGYGPVKAAELTLRIRSLNGMSKNDSLYLEHTGARGFAWASRIEGLLGRWRGGAARTLHLDLARLPLPDGKTLDLRPSLEDGLLDVVLQDDTAVEAMSIRIVR